MKASRQPPITEDQIDQLTGLLRDGMSIASSAKYLRISGSSLEKWIRKFPTLREVVDEAIAHHEHFLLARATAYAQRDGKIAIALLERRYAHWVKTDRREVTADITQTSVSPALLAALAAGKEEVAPPNARV